jgi:hypothetical protein
VKLLDGADESAAKAKRTDVARKALRTAKWARIMTKWMITHSSKGGVKWQVVSFNGPQGQESYGIVDMIAIRKNHTKPTSTTLWCRSPDGCRGGDRLCFGRRCRRTEGATREGWLGHAVRRTVGPMAIAVGPMAIVLAITVLAGLAIGHWLPGAKTLLQVLERLF